MRLGGPSIEVRQLRAGNAIPLIADPLAQLCDIESEQRHIDLCLRIALRFPEDVALVLSDLESNPRARKQA